MCFRPFPPLHPLDNCDVCDIVTLSEVSVFCDIGGRLSKGKRMADKRLLTTGEIAKHCGVDFRTVSRWIDAGRIKAFRLPVRGDRRVEAAEFVRFLRENDMPIPEEFREHSRRVLVVEDEEPVTAAICETLQDAGFETQVAADGFSAGLLTESYAPAVMTLDLNIPGLNGQQVLERVRATPHLSHVRILVVSGMPEQEREAALQAGADDVLPKPFGLDDLVEKVAALAGVEVPGEAEVGGTLDA